MNNINNFAVIDLGSNSFRLEIFEIQNRQVRSSKYLKEVVRLGGGLDANSNLTPSAIAKALICIINFAELISKIPKENIIAVATQTLREAKNRELFINTAQYILGVDIEVISGKEEAQLIYQGVGYFLTNLPKFSQRQLLVIDIGGRSTEIIWGQGEKAIAYDSFPVGSVNLSLDFFPFEKSTIFSEDAFNSACKFSLEFFKTFAEQYLSQQNINQNNLPPLIYGSAGTIGALAKVINNYELGSINFININWLKNELINARNFEGLELKGLKDDRKAVIGGGLAIVLTLLSLFNLPEITPARGSLRHGVLLKMLAKKNITF